MLGDTTTGAKYHFASPLVSALMLVRMLREPVWPLVDHVKVAVFTPKTLLFQLVGVVVPNSIDGLATIGVDAAAIGNDASSISETPTVSNA